MDLDKMTTDAIEQRISDIAADISSIKQQLFDAKTYAAETGQYADRDWFNRASFALRARGAEHQKLMMYLGKRKKNERRAYNSRHERKFIEVAKLRLDDDVFSKIMTEALLLSEH